MPGGGKSTLRKFTIRTFMVKFTLIQTANYEPFMRQCLENTINLNTRRLERDKSGPNAKFETTLGHVLCWARLAKTQNLLITSFYLYQLFKYRLISLIGNSSRLRYLDCFILGRFRFFGRTSSISGEIASIFLLTFLIYRWTIHLTRPRFKFYAFEFLMSSQEEVLKHELEGRKLVQREAPGERPPPYADGRPESQLVVDLPYADARIKDRLLTDARRNLPRETFRIDSVFYLKSPPDQDGNSRWILRLNRTGKNWRVLNFCAQFIFGASILNMLCWFSLMYYVLAGAVLTNFGFEMAYPRCVSWLREIQTKGASQRQSVGCDYLQTIHQTGEGALAHGYRLDNIPARIPLDSQDVQRASLYNVARISADIIEIHLIHLDSMFHFIAQLFMFAIHCTDIVFNALEIKVRLLDLIRKLDGRHRLIMSLEDKIRCYAKLVDARKEEIIRSDNEHTRQIVVSTKTPTHMTPVFLLHTSDYDLHLILLEVDKSMRQLQASSNQSLSEEIVDLQAILADHFDTITRTYNLFISFDVGLMCFLWLGYTLIICTWMISNKSQSIEWEFLIAETAATLVSLTLMSGAALVRSMNAQLYPLITRAMALDPDLLGSKLRWIKILNYYHPRPLYCFTMIGNTEISWLLCFKLVAWIVSIFILLANFFYNNRRF